MNTQKELNRQDAEDAKRMGPSPSPALLSPALLSRGGVRRRAQCPVCHCRETRIYSVRTDVVEDPDPRVMSHVLRYRYHLCRCSYHWQTAIEVVERTI